MTIEKLFRSVTVLAASAIAWLAPGNASASTLSATVQAVRMAGKITCGSMPATDPAFQTMVAKLSATPPDYMGAATAAVQSKYFARCLPLRMARQMQNPTLSEAGVPVSQSIIFIVGELVGAAGTQPSISKLWSDNATFIFNQPGGNCWAQGSLGSTCVIGGAAPFGGPPGYPGGTARGQYCTSLDPQYGTFIGDIDWQTQVIKVPAQCVVDSTLTVINSGSPPVLYSQLPQMHVGGYMTLSNTWYEKNFAEAAMKAGTNLRAIEFMYEIATGWTVPQMETTQAPPLTNLAPNAPAFVHAADRNFSSPVSQTACLACHGGGVSSLKHGYNTFADLFDYVDTAYFGMWYNSTIPAPQNRKSNGSDPTIRANTVACTTSNYATNNCNPYSQLADDTNFSWDLSDFAPVQSGAWGWHGPLAGNGLNALGQALGQADIVYQFMTKRVVNEICPPVQNFPQATINQIAAQAKTLDSFPYIVEAVASNPACL